MDATAAGTVKADGTAIFTSAKSYFDVKRNQKKYLFTLENAGKKANYEITVILDVVPQYKITITQPQNGTIKVYKLSAGQKTYLELVDESGKKIVKVGKDQVVYFELVADQGKTPTKLTVDGTDNTTVTTNIPQQTAGAIAVRHKCTKDIEVSGECN